MTDQRIVKRFAVPDRPMRILSPFARAWFADPRRVGAIAPSGRSLARLITRQLGASSGPVIEIGPGTGVFTDAILKSGVRADQLVLIERSASLATALRYKFPDVRVIEADASALAGSLFGAGVVGAVISGIPILTMPDADVRALLTLAFDELRVGGAFFQFTYGLRCPIGRSVLAGLKLHAERVGTTVRNLPPATVYRITRINERHH